MTIIEAVAETCSLFLQGMVEVGKIVLSSYMYIFDIVKRLITAPNTVTYIELMLLLVILVLLIWGIVTLKLIHTIIKD